MKLKVLFLVTLVCVYLYSGAKSQAPETMNDYVRYLGVYNSGVGMQARSVSGGPAYFQMAIVSTDTVANPNTSTVWIGTPNGWDRGEDYVIKTGCGGPSGLSMVWLKDYANVNGAKYPVRTIKSQYVEIATGMTFDITDWCNSDPLNPSGHVFSMYSVNGAAYNYVIKVWFEIWIAGHPNRRGFFMSRYVMGQSSTNTCMGLTKPIIKVSDLYWEQNPAGSFDAEDKSVGLWDVGGASGSPYDPSGNPILVTGFWYGRTNELAKGYGSAWNLWGLNSTGQEVAGTRSCMSAWWLFP